MTLTKENIEVIMKTPLNKEEAFYLKSGDVFVGARGCQPSNSFCLLVGPFDYCSDDLTIAEIQECLSDF